MKKTNKLYFVTIQADGRGTSYKTEKLMAALY